VSIFGLVLTINGQTLGLRLPGVTEPP